MDSLDKFQQFFDCCVGTWETERTYHYLTSQEVERSHTKFMINPLTSESKAKVLDDNNYLSKPDLAISPGYQLSFETVSESGEKVAQQLNLLFVPIKIEPMAIEGDYLRDRAYEESRPMISHFRFDCQTQELLMTTNYTQVVSVDSITLINPNLRIRKIMNYARPSAGLPLNQLILVGFGVEQK